jgi:hypothetical protein
MQSRRIFLKSTAALCLASLAVPAFGQSTIPRQPIEAAFGSAIKTTAGVAGNDPRLLSYYTKFSAELNAAAGANGSSWFRTFAKIAKGSVRLGGRLIFGRLGTAVQIGVVVLTGATSFYWYELESAEALQIKSCRLGSQCRVVDPITGVTHTYTRTQEGDQTGLWSLAGARGGNKWSAVQQQHIGTKATPLYTYDVWWKYVGSGTFDPNYLIPNQGSVSTTGALMAQAVEDLLRERGEQTVLDRQMIADATNAINDKILADATTVTDARQIAELIGQVGVSPNTVGYVPFAEPRVGDLIGTTPIDRPIAVADPATATTTGSGTGGTTGTQTGTQTGTPPIDMTVPTPAEWPTIMPVDWWPSPFTAPTLNATCVNPGGSLASLGQVTIPLCDMVDLMAPVLRPVVAGVSLVAAGKVILDI